MTGDIDERVDGLQAGGRVDAVDRELHVFRCMVFNSGTLDAQTGGMRAEFVPDSTMGGPGDQLHPNRAGYAAMAAAIDLAPLLA